MSNTSTNLQKRTQSAIIEESIFRPRSGIILAATLILTVVFLPFWWIVAPIGLLLWIMSFIETWFNSAIYKKAVAHAVELDFEPKDIEAGLKAQEIETVLETLVKSIRQKVPIDIFDKVESIKTTILEILPHIENINLGDQNIYNIGQVALTYLPETLENYLKLPSSARKKLLKDGKTAHQLLLEQLDLLDAELKETLEDFIRNDTERLLVHGRFLEEKFGKSDLLIE